MPATLYQDAITLRLIATIITPALTTPATLQPAVSLLRLHPAMTTRYAQQMNAILLWAVSSLRFPATTTAHVLRMDVMRLVDA